MSDFLISCCRQYSGEALLALIKELYGNRCSKGKHFDFTWGRISILEDRLAENNNIIVKDNTVVAWVGDLTTEMSEGFIGALISRIREIAKCENGKSASLEEDNVFKKLNGAFSIVVAMPESLAMITDPRNFVQTYAGFDDRKRIVAFGTHSDLVEILSDTSQKKDIVSMAEFLNLNRCTFPKTMYENVKELNAGNLHIATIKEHKTELRSIPYWVPPKELQNGYDEDALAEELRGAFYNAVTRRCKGDKIGVLLSGGLDSRLIMASVPEPKQCIGFTFFDKLNREARTARKVSRCYNRLWVPLIRSKDHLGDSIVDTAKLNGCTALFVNSHAVGFTETILSYDIGSLLDGTQMDVYLKGHFVIENMGKVKQSANVLPTRPDKTLREYTYNIDEIWKDHLRADIIEQMYSRRKDFYKKYADNSRSSIAEGLYLHPKDSSLAGWIAQRRVLPIRLVVLDRQLLDFSFKCPLKLKLGKKIFLKASLPMYGPGAKVPYVADGVRPGSGQWSTRLQRIIRILENKTVRLLEKLGKETVKPGSWPDYQKYWQQSAKLTDLIKEYGANLDQFDGTLFKGRGQDLLHRRTLHWEYGFRLLQLAVWSGIIKQYRRFLP